MVHIHILMFISTKTNSSPSKHFQKSQLQFFWPHLENIIKCFSEGRIILFRKSGNQIEMLVNFTTFLDHCDCSSKLFKILFSSDKFICVVIGRLNPNFKAKKSFWSFLI